jgi:epsilon-lactone hydrolase
MSCSYLTDVILLHLSMTGLQRLCRGRPSRTVDRDIGLGSQRLPGKNAMSLVMKAIVWSLGRRPGMKRTAEASAELVAAPREDAPLPGNLAKRCNVTRHSVAGMPVITLEPKRDASGTNVIYIHGGAYIAPLLKPHWTIIGDLLRRTNATITVPLYPLAPEHTAAEVLPALRTLYDSVQATGAPVVLAGDSAGGGLALSLAVQLRDDGASLPSSILLFSPWLDITMTNPEIPALEAKDVLLSTSGLLWSGKHWAGDLPATDPRVSPIYANLDGLPPISIYQGGRDVFLADSTLFTANAQRAGAAVELRTYPDGFHVFIAVAFAPESRRALSHASSLIRAAA